MIEWVRRLFAQRQPDPALRRLQMVHAARVAKVAPVVERAVDVAETVVQDSREDLMRASFGRGERRLGGR